MTADIQRATRKVRYDLAAARLIGAIKRLQLILRYNPYWHLQPRVPAGTPREGGQWVGVVRQAASLLPVLQRVGLAAIRRLRDVTRRVSPYLRRLPRRWDDNSSIFADEDYDRETRRIGPPSWQRHGHPNIRFRNERELREYLGPAGPEREWHHIVEKRLVADGRFAAELIHSTDNIISLPVQVHRRINAIMSAKDDHHGVVRRRWLERLSYGEQYNFGLELIQTTSEELGYEFDRY